MDHSRVIGEWIIGEKLGRGAFAVVWKAKHRHTGELAAVKEIELERLNKRLRQSLDGEISILKRISHAHIVKLYQVIEEGSTLFLVMEYCAGGDLAALVRSRRTVPEATAKKIMQQLAAGLKEMTLHNFVHRDLKPQNLLLASEYDANDIALKIADFGFARALQPQRMAETLCGSPLYMAPEILHHHKYDAKADLWSVGAILFELISGNPPFDAVNQFQLLRAIERREATLPPSVSVSLECQDLLKLLLKRNPIERIGFDEFFQHPFLRGDTWTTTEVAGPDECPNKSNNQSFVSQKEKEDHFQKETNRKSGDNAVQRCSLTPPGAACAPTTLGDSHAKHHRPVLRAQSAGSLLVSSSQRETLRVGHSIVGFPYTKKPADDHLENVHTTSETERHDLSIHLQDIFPPEEGKNLEEKKYATSFGKRGASIEPPSSTCIVGQLTAQLKPHMLLGRAPTQNRLPTSSSSPVLLSTTAADEDGRSPKMEGEIGIPPSGEGRSVERKEFCPPAFSPHVCFPVEREKKGFQKEESTLCIEGGKEEEEEDFVLVEVHAVEASLEAPHSLSPGQRLGGMIGGRRLSPGEQRASTQRASLKGRQKNPPPEDIFLLEEFSSTPAAAQTQDVCISKKDIGKELREGSLSDTGEWKKDGAPVHSFGEAGRKVGNDRSKTSSSLWSRSDMILEVVCGLEMLAAEKERAAEERLALLVAAVEILADEVAGNADPSFTHDECMIQVQEKLEKTLEAADACALQLLSGHIPSETSRQGGGLAPCSEKEGGQSGHRLPNPWKLFFLGALSWAKNAALDELLGRRKGSLDGYTRALMSLEFLYASLCDDSPSKPKKIMSPVEWIDQDRVLDCIEAIQTRRSRCSATKHSPETVRSVL